MPASSAVIVSAIAGAGLEGLTNVFVAIDGATGKVSLATTPGATDIYGVLLQGAAEDEVVNVHVRGPIAGVKAGGAIQPGDYVTVGAGGAAFAASTGNTVVGQYVPSYEVDGFPTVATGDELFDLNIADLKLTAAP
tara:strand:+ start:5804 stop:6211 length:408 start_codon:yes stop_codon:yes gene_type:complete